MKLIYEITREDYAEFNKFHFIKKRLTRTIIIGVLTIVIVQIVLNQKEFDLFPTIVSSVLCAGLYVFSIMRAIKRTGNIPRNDGTILGRKEFEFTDEKISFVTNSSQGTFLWAAIVDVQEGQKAFYLYLDANAAIMIPKLAFENEVLLKEFKSLIRRKTMKGDPLWDLNNSIRV